MISFKSFFLGLALCAGLHSEAQTIKGKIFGKGQGDKEILPGATVVWINSNTAAMANANGVFEISAINVSDKRLVASFMGYRSDTIVVGEQTYISITLMAEPTKLGDVTIKGSGTGHTTTEVITEKELTKAACCDLAGCFETQATVQPQTTNVITNSKELRILGLSGVYNQVLFDGFPMFQGLTYTYGISGYPGTLVDNIFVSKGANSVLQGYESISGQINVIPKDPDKTDAILLNIYANSFYEKHFNLNLADSIGKSKKWRHFLAAHVVQPAGSFDRDGDNFLDVPKLTRFMIYNRWKFGDDRKEGLYTNIGVRYLAEQRVGGQKNFDPDDHKGGYAVYGQFVNYFEPELNLKTGYRFNENHAVTLIASSFYQQQKSWFGPLKYEATQLNAYANLQHEVNWREDHSLKYGVSLRYQDLDETISTQDTFRTYGGKYQTLQQVPGIFAENTFHWNEDKIVLIVGARLDRHQVFGYQFTPRSMLKYAYSPNKTIRLSAGTGWRQVNLFSENINLLASSRDIIFQETLRPEKGFNWGASYTYKYSRDKYEGTVSADFYQTLFQNQFFPDYDSDPTKAFIRNFTGTSVSNAFQIEASVKLNKIYEFKAAYNYLDVYRMIERNKYVLPFNPRNRAMIAASYRPESNKFYFDLNAHWYDRQKLPNTESNPVEYRNPSWSKPYALLNAQVTYRIKKLEIYSGVENILDFRQKRPILGWQDPFGKYFDTSSVWGPTRGREIYLGLRYRI